MFSYDSDTAELLARFKKWVDSEGVDPSDSDTETAPEIPRRGPQHPDPPSRRQRRHTRPALHHTRTELTPTTFAPTDFPAAGSIVMPRKEWPMRKFTLTAGLVAVTVIVCGLAFVVWLVAQNLPS